MKIQPVNINNNYTKSLKKSDIIFNFDFHVHHLNIIIQNILEKIKNLSRQIIKSVQKVKVWLLR